MIVAAIVLYAGVTSCGESIKKIINPESADYSLFSIIITIPPKVQMYAPDAHHMFIVAHNCVFVKKA